MELYVSTWGTIVQSRGHCGISKSFFPLLATYLWSNEDENAFSFLFPIILLQHITLSAILSFSLNHYHFEATSTYRVVYPCLLTDLCVASSSLKGDWKYSGIVAWTPVRPFFSKHPSLASHALHFWRSSLLPPPLLCYLSPFNLFLHLTHFHTFLHEYRNLSLNPLCLKILPL